MHIADRRNVKLESKKVFRESFGKLKIGKTFQIVFVGNSQNNQILLKTVIPAKYFQPMNEWISLERKSVLGRYLHGALWLVEIRICLPL